MKKLYFSLLVSYTSLSIIAQNVGVNTTGAAPSATNLLEVLQISTTANTVGIYSEHSGVVGSGTAYGLQAISNGAGVNNVAAYLQAVNGTSSNYALIVPPGGGNVGIGTTAPGATLAIQETITSGILQTFYGAGNSRLFFERANGTPTTPTTVVNGDRTAAIVGRGYDGSAFSNSSIIFFEVDGAVSAGDVPGRIMFYTKPAGGGMSERMRIQSDGNVGIGTTAPGYKFEVTGQALFSQGIGVGNATPHASNGVNSAGSYQISGNNAMSDAGTALQMGSSTATAWDDLEFDVNGVSAAMMIKGTSGNIGIGTSTPDRLLDVHGDVEIGNLGKLYVGVNGGGTPAITLNNGSGSVGLGSDILLDASGLISAEDNMHFTIDSDNGTTGAFFDFGKDTETNAATSLMRIQEDGNVGIGTTSPVKILHITDGTAVTTPPMFRIQAKTEAVTDPGDVYAGIELGVVGGENSAGAQEVTAYIKAIDTRTGTTSFEDGGLAFGTLTNVEASPSTKMTLTHDGNLGINCTSPAQKLYVSGNIYATGTVLGSQAACSDLRWKKDFKPLTGALQSVLSLNGLYYNWKKEEFPEKDFSSRREIGLIAQEVEKIYPELIFTDEQGYKYLDYSHLTPVLIEAIKDLSAISEGQQQIIERLKAENSNKTSDIEELKSEIIEIKAILNQNSKK